MLIMFGEWIKKRREHLGLSQEELVARLQLNGLDVARSTVSSWEIGKHVTPLDSLIAVRAIAQSLEMSLGEIMGELGYLLPDQSLDPAERAVINALRRGDKLEAIRLISKP